jgi:hypothetical protein
LGLALSTNDIWDPTAPVQYCGRISILEKGSSTERKCHIYRKKALGIEKFKNHPSLQKYRDWQLITFSSFAMLSTLHFINKRITNNISAEKT